MASAMRLKQNGPVPSPQGLVAGLAVAMHLISFLWCWCLGPSLSRLVMHSKETLATPINWMFPTRSGAWMLNHSQLQVH